MERTTTEAPNCDDDPGTTPPGVSPAATAPRQWAIIPPVPVRCRSQAAGESPRYARPRYALTWREVSGALGDLGTFLPHIIGAVTVAGLAPSGVLTTFGLFYLASGAYFGVPLGVQPMKAASAAILIQRLTPGEVAGAGLVIGALFLLAGLTGAVGRLARIIPPAVTAGLQLGLGLALAGLGLRLLREQLWLGLAVAALLLALLGSRHVPAALVALVAGTGLAWALGLTPPFPHLHPGLYLPRPLWPTWGDVARGTQLAVLPQIPLTLTNAIIVTAGVTRQLFPKEEHRADERALAVSTGLGNLLAAPLGGYLMCHGAGGIAGHYRFGARTAAAPALIGLAFLALGLGLGDGALALLALIPPAVVGSLLFFSGIELALASAPGRFAGPDLFVVLVIGALGVAANPAIAFAVGLPLAIAVKRGIVRLDPPSGPGHA